MIFHSENLSTTAQPCAWRRTADAATQTLAAAAEGQRVYCGSGGNEAPHPEVPLCILNEVSV